MRRRLFGTDETYYAVIFISLLIVNGGFALFGFEKLAGHIQKPNDRPTCTKNEPNVPAAAIPQSIAEVHTSASSIPAFKSQSGPSIAPQPRMPRVPDGVLILMSPLFWPPELKRNAPRAPSITTLPVPLFGS